MKKITLIGLFVIICSSCSGYREAPLTEEVTIVEKIQTDELKKIDLKLPGDPVSIDEKEAIHLALTFNPNIRIPILHDRGWGDTDVQLRGAVHPELHVDNQSITAAFTVDTLNLYNLLSPTERHAWQAERDSERTQAWAEQHASAVYLTRDVRLAFLDLARLNEHISILSDEVNHFNQYKIKNNQSVLLTITEIELNQQIEKLAVEVSTAKSNLTRLIGGNPLQTLSFDFNNELLIPVMPKVESLLEVINAAKKDSWVLKSLAANYVQKEYALREAYSNRWGTLSIGPSITVSPGNSSVGASLHLRVPWPSNMEDALRDATDNRLLAAAQYTQALHNLESDITQQYNLMLAKWQSAMVPTLSVTSLCEQLNKEENGMTAHEYLDISNRLFNQKIHLIDEMAKYKMSVIILESLL